MCNGRAEATLQENKAAVAEKAGGSEATHGIFREMQGLFSAA